MGEHKMLSYITEVLDNTPKNWLALTTHRLDIYTEKLAKTEFLEQFELLYNQQLSDSESLEKLPTAYDYIRLGHPLSCVLEWTVARLNGLTPDAVISFSSKTMPILAILRKNFLDQKPTKIFYTSELPAEFDVELIKAVYGYEFERCKVDSPTDIQEFEGTSIFIATHEDFKSIPVQPAVDFYVTSYAHLGSVLLANGAQNQSYISEIQHVRRRETVAMTPANCVSFLRAITGSEFKNEPNTSFKPQVLEQIKEITQSPTHAVVGSSGLSIQYAITMGLIHDALENHSGKNIKIIVPPNCYGGTNDQARRVAACLPNVEVVDLPVDGDNDMVQSIDKVLTQLAEIDAVPFIIAEIPTNPRVEVPDLGELKAVLSQSRHTQSGEKATEPVFILDQTFCPNVHFLGENDTLSNVKAISYASGSKFPSGGLCTAGYCVANKKASHLMVNIEKHLILCDNEATDYQYELLAQQLPSMNQRISDAYKNTREFVNFITETLPEAKINFVSEELAALGFTPSVFSLDLPTKGGTHEERENYKRELNHRLIDLMISQIPAESKYCVSYGQLKGCYWTIPATSTQGTTKESDKDYIARVALSPDMDLELHKKVFLDFVQTI